MASRSLTLHAVLHHQSKHQYRLGLPISVRPCYSLVVLMRIEVWVEDDHCRQYPLLSSIRCSVHIHPCPPKPG
jgi:hypothetical protein